MKGAVFTAALAVLSAGAVGGCAFTDVQLTVPTAASVATGANRGGGRELVVVVPLKDGRPDQRRCGMKKNGYNMDTANVNCTVPPPVLLGDLLIRELSTAGFRVLRDYRQASPSTIIISGTLNQFFVEPVVGFFTFTPEADIELKLTAQTTTGLWAERRFYVKAEEVSMVGSGENIQLAYEAALKKTLMAMVGAITSLVDQYPPPASAPRPPVVAPPTASAPSVAAPPTAVSSLVNNGERGSK